MRQTYDATIRLTPEELDFYNSLLSITSREVYDRYGLKRDEGYTYTATFPDGTEADVKLVICEGEETPYCEAVFFQHGCEIGHTDVTDKIDGEHQCATDDAVYTVTVTSE